MAQVKFRFAPAKERSVESRQEAEELFIATEHNAKLRYEGYKKLSEM